MNFKRLQMYSFQYLQEIFQFVKTSKLIEVTSIFFTLSTLLRIKINEIFIQRSDEIHHLGEFAHQLLLRIEFLDYLLRPFYKRDWICKGFDKIRYSRQERNFSVKIYPGANQIVIVDISGIHTTILITKSQSKMYLQLTKYLQKLPIYEISRYQNQHIHMFWAKQDCFAFA